MVEINSDGYTCKHTALEVYITKYIIKHASNSIGNNSHKSQAITPPKAVARRFWEDRQFWILKRSMTIEKLKITAKDNTFFWSIITKQSNNNYKECTKASQIWANKPLKEARPEIITKTSFLQKKSAIKLFNSQIHADYKKIYSTKTHTWQSYIGYISDTENTYQIIKQNFTFQKRKKKKKAWPVHVRNTVSNEWRFRGRASNQSENHFPNFMAKLISHHWFVRDSNKQKPKRKENKKALNRKVEAFQLFAHVVFTSSLEKWKSWDWNHKPTKPKSRLQIREYDANTESAPKKTMEQYIIKIK